MNFKCKTLFREVKLSGEVYAQDYQEGDCARLAWLHQQGYLVRSYGSWSGAVTYKMPARSVRSVEVTDG